MVVIFLSFILLPQYRVSIAPRLGFFCRLERHMNTPLQLVPSSVVERKLRLMSAGSCFTTLKVSLLETVCFTYRRGLLPAKALPSIYILSNGTLGTITLTLLVSFP